MTDSLDDDLLGFSGASRWTASAGSLGKETVNDFSIATRSPPHGSILAELAAGVHRVIGTRISLDCQSGRSMGGVPLPAPLAAAEGITEEDVYRCAREVRAEQWTERQKDPKDPK